MPLTEPIKNTKQRRRGEDEETEAGGIKPTRTIRKKDKREHSGTTGPIALEIYNVGKRRTYRKQSADRSMGCRYEHGQKDAPAERERERDRYTIAETKNAPNSSQEKR